MLRGHEGFIVDLSSSFLLKGTNPLECVHKNPTSQRMRSSTAPTYNTLCQELNSGMQISRSLACRTNERQES